MQLSQSGLSVALQRLKKRSTFLNRLVEPVARRLRSRTARIRAGAGAGLRFNPHGAPLATTLGINEPAVQEVLSRHLCAGATFFDIGANVGFFSVIGARLVGPTGRVLAFEPFPSMAAAVRFNARINGLTQVEVIEQAVAERAGRERLQIRRDDPTRASLESAGAAGTESIDVDVVALDPLVEDGTLPAPDFIKIDIEGAEVQALAGMRRTIVAHRPTVLYEVHGTQEPCAAFFRGLGYELTPVEGPGPAESIPDYTHVLAMPGRV